MRWLQALALLFVSQMIDANRNCSGRILLEKFHINDSRLLKIRVNTPLELECQLNKMAIKSGCNASNLSYLGYTSATDRIQYSTNSLYLKVNTARARQLNVTCTYDGLNGDTMKINIDGKLQKLECLIYNLTQLDCIYNMTRKFHPDKFTFKMKNETSGYEPVDFRYDIIDEIYTFTEDGYFNPFGQFTMWVNAENKVEPPRNETFSFKTNQIVCLPEDFEIKLQRVNSSNAIVVWDLPEIFNKYEFDHAIELIGPHFEEHFITGGRVKTTNSTGLIKFEVDIRLKYAYTEYHLVIYTCVTNALNCAEQQGVGNLTFESKKRIPDSPPPIIPGAFEYHKHNQSVIVYWGETAPHHRNGDNFTVKLHEVRSNGQLITNIKSSLLDTSISLDFLNPKDEYEIRLIAENSEGESENYSTIMIPKTVDLLDPPLNLKIVQNNSLSHLYWTTTNVTIDKFSLFWCTSVNQQCQGHLSGIHIAGNHKNFTFNHSLYGSTPSIFAISSNLKAKTSGLKWFTCITSTKSKLAKIEAATIDPINETTVLLRWMLPCNTNPFIKSIEISYCKVRLGKNESCQTVTSRSIETNVSSKVLIDNLLPHTNYNLSLLMFDGNSRGPARHIQFETNFGVPDPPTHVNYLIATNGTVTIFWTPPKNWFGEPHAYKIKYESKTDSGTYTSTDLNYSKLTKLKRYTNYTIQVAACHVICSAFSNKIFVNTKLGGDTPLIIYILVLVFLIVLIILTIVIIVKVGLKRYKNSLDLHVSLPPGLDSIFGSRLHCDELNSNIWGFIHHDLPQTITCEELQEELELKQNFQEYNIEIGGNSSIVGNNVEIHIQNQQYVRISDLMLSNNV